MKHDPFTVHLDRSLTDFVTKTSDDEFRRAFHEAEYDFYSGVEEPTALPMRELVFSGEVRIAELGGPFPIGVYNARNLLVTQRLSAIVAETPTPAADHQDLALAA